MFSRTVSEIIDRHPVHVTAEASLAEVAQAMASKGRGCVFVRENEAVSGMITEGSLLKCLLEIPAAEATASRAMLAPAPGIAVGGIVPHACRILQEKRVKHLAVYDTAGLLVGVISDMDLATALGLDYMMENTTCQTIMSKSVLAGPPEMTARAVAQALLERRMGCMLTVMDGRPTGIVTEWDLAVKGPFLADGLDSPVAGLLSSPVTCVPQTGMVYKVILHLRQKGLRHAPVVDDSGRIQGILTFSDIIRRAVGFA
ncbi:CBS domain-containing protein [Desulfolutivibrio sp.]|uniref:CBS domain-containing protein n=1 Tax=Desulfolutivibrio sp. TaxID=2773296 RepID=UPI002F962A9C